MKRSFFLPLVLLVFSIGCVACGNPQPRSQDNGNRVSDAGQESARQLVKEEWSKSKELGRKLSRRAGDEWIHGKIVAELIANKTTPERRISVDVVNHVVTLHGSVENAAQKTEAERIAKQTRGVARVNNLLDVSA
jgi:osmotically-inducible protein OsmY